MFAKQTLRERVHKLWNGVHSRSGNPPWNELSKPAQNGVVMFAASLLDSYQPTVRRARMLRRDDTPIEVTVIGLGTRHVSIVADEPIDPSVFYSLRDE